MGDSKFVMAEEQNIKLGGIKFPRKLCPAKNSPDKDRIYTPTLLARRIVEHFNPYGKCLEPCCGKDAFVMAMKGREMVTSVNVCEIDSGIDFLTAPLDNDYDFIITNPPYSKFRAFLKRSMQLANNIIFLCPINHIVGLTARMRDIKEAGFYIREICEVDKPKDWPSSGFRYAAIQLARKRHTGMTLCKFSELGV